VTSTQSFARARRPEHKQQRRGAILAAAEDLARREGVRGVTLAAVAAAVGLAKSNVLRYFGTREEIYLVLMTQQWQGWTQEISARLDGCAAGPAELAELSAVLADSLVGRPLFCDLQSVLATSLEQNVGLEAAREYKRAAVRSLDLAGRMIAARTELTPAEGFELAAAATTFAGMLWPIAHPPTVLRTLYEQEPELARACPPFRATLERLIHSLAEGLPRLRAAEPRGPGWA
jgi:AcrR family transcriptional regulator